MTKVYVWPSNLGASVHYGDPTRIRTTSQWDGAPGQKVEHAQRSVWTVEGNVDEARASDFDIMMDRLSGGQHLVALWDMGLRRQNGWDSDVALNSSGEEFWRKDGDTSSYNGESDNAPTGPWRSIFAAANGGASAGDISLAVDGLLDSEAIPKGDMIRVGDYRHRVLTAVTANASGEATLTLARPLRAAVADDANVRIPGDLFVGSLVSREISPVDLAGIRTFTLRFVEVYEDEITDNSVSPAVGFEWTGL